MNGPAADSPSVGPGAAQPARHIRRNPLGRPSALPAQAGRTPAFSFSGFNGSQAFVHLMCIFCLLLQRFGASFAHGQQLFLCIIAVPLLSLWMLVARKARFDALTGTLYLLVAFCFLLSSVVANLDPDLHMRFSILSIGEILVVYAVLAIEPAIGFDTKSTLKVVAFYARLIAVAAIVQYALQFIGIRLFSFAQFAPFLSPVLTETGYHVAAPIAYGSSTFRSNGFFLLEPSILSQIMAIGVVVDYFVLSRISFLPVFAVALLASYSGTGLLALAITLLLTGLFVPRRLTQMLVFFVVAGVVALGCAAAFPREFAALAARASGSDPSSRLRYAAQLSVLKTIADNARLAIGFGPGSSDGYVISGSMSAGLKLLFDYGLIGASAFTAFILRVIWRPDLPMLSLICLAIFLTGGGYLVFSPFVFLMGLICIWSRPWALAPAVAHRPGAQARRASA
jgi:hypothetical protein